MKFQLVSAASLLLLWPVPAVPQGYLGSSLEPGVLPLYRSDPGGSVPDTSQVRIQEQDQTSTTSSDLPRAGPSTIRPTELERRPQNGLNRRPQNNQQENPRDGLLNESQSRPQKDFQGASASGAQDRPSIGLQGRPQSDPQGTPQNGFQDGSQRGLPGRQQSGLQQRPQNSQQDIQNGFQRRPQNSQQDIQNGFQRRPLNSQQEIIKQSQQGSPQNEFQKRLQSDGQDVQQNGFQIRQNGLSRESQSGIRKENPFPVGSEMGFDRNFRTPPRGSLSHGHIHSPPLTWYGHRHPFDHFRF